MRGHGRSASPRDPDQYAEARVLDDMRAILDDVGAKRAVIGGLSLGGYMSLAFAEAEPARTQALMVFDTGPGYRNDEAREGWNRNARRTADAIDAKGFAGLTSSSAEVAAAQHADPAGLALAARHMLVQSDGHVIERLADLTMPTLVLVGELDQPFLAASEYMARKIPNARKVVLEGAGHAANLDRPKGFNVAVLDFLALAVPATMR
jgi:pimeloyl-ACP methyl ester carboxylesterase